MSNQGSRAAPKGPKDKKVQIGKEQIKQESPGIIHHLFSLTKNVSFLVGLIAVSFGLFINFGFQVKFPVHETGVVLITGTSSGIGHNASFEVAKHGYVVFCGVRKEKDVTSLKEEAKQRGLEDKIIPIILDVTKSEQITSSLKAVTEYLEKHGYPFVGLVNNAAISFRLPVEIAPIGEVKSLFNVNYFGTVEITQTFLPLIRKHKGRIVFISSVMGIISNYGSAFYSGTKRAIEGLVDSFREEMRPFEVSVSSVLPGYIDTSIVENVKPFKEFKIPPENVELYKPNLEKISNRRKLFQEMAVSPQITSDVIFHALTDPYPKTRYLVGPTSKVLNAKMLHILVGILPDRFIDWIKEGSA